MRNKSKKRWIYIVLKMHLQQRQLIEFIGLKLKALFLQNTYHVSKSWPCIRFAQLKRNVEDALASFDQNIVHLKWRLIENGAQSEPRWACNEQLWNGFNRTLTCYFKLTWLSVQILSLFKKTHSFRKQFGRILERVFFLQSHGLNKRFDNGS